MADMIKIPGVGPTKKVYVVAGVGILGGILAFAYWKRSQAPAGEAGPAVVDSTGTGGFTEDSTAAGYNTVYPPASYSPYGYDLYGNPIPPPTGAGSNGVYTNNNDWASAAESALENGNISLSVSTLAISRVLGGLSVTTDQRDIFLQAVGLIGQPPQGYPQPIKLTDSGTGTTTPPGGPLAAPTGLKVTSTTKTTVGLHWNTVPGAVHYRVYDNASSYNVGDSADGEIRIGGLRSNTTYHFYVRALDATNHLGAKSTSVSGRTKK